VSAISSTTASTTLDTYTKTYTSFSGADIVATFNNVVIGELQAISYTVNREKAPIYTMGSPDPRSFSRGKRGVGGSLVFVFFDRDALLDALTGLTATGQSGNTAQAIQTFAANAADYQNNILQTALSDQGYAGINSWDTTMSNSGYSNLTTTITPVYVDQLLPFNVAVHFANEYGQMAQLDILDVEILNNGMSLSIDDVVTEQVMSFVARSVTAPQPVTQFLGG
jgi:hypothetical protein